MISKLTTRKLAGVLIASALVLSGSIALSASADAAGKQGSACTTLKSKSGSYTCIANPLKTTPKYVWATQNCVDAQASYLADADNLSKYVKSSSDAIAQQNDTVSSFKNAQQVAQTELDNMTNTDVFAIEYVPLSKPPVPSVTVVGYQNAITAHKAKIAADLLRVQFYTDALSKDVKGSAKAIGDQKSINDFNVGIKSRQDAIDHINAKVTRLQNQITNDIAKIGLWTTNLQQAIARQKGLNAQLTSAVSIAKTTRTAACKTGL